MQQAGRGRKAMPANWLWVVVWSAPKVNKTIEWSIAEIGLLIPS